MLKKPCFAIGLANWGLLLIFIVFLVQPFGNPHILLQPILAILLFYILIISGGASIFGIVACSIELNQKNCTKAFFMVNIITHTVYLIAYCGLICFIGVAGVGV